MLCLCLLLLSVFFSICVMYSAKEKERRRILAQGCEKLSLGLGVLKQVDKCRRLFYELQASWKKEGTTPKKKKDEGELLWLSFKSMYNVLIWKSYQSLIPYSVCWISYNEHSVMYFRLIVDTVWYVVQP